MAAAAQVQPRRRPTVTQYVITDNAIPENHLIFEGVDATPENGGPTFTISEIAKFFFGRSAHWVRWRERTGAFTYEGKPVGIHRTPKGARMYDLADVEKMAHALAGEHHITAEELLNILKLVLIEGKVWGVLP